MNKNNKMVVTVKNPTLKKKVFRQLNKYSDEALKAYASGNMAKGRVMEKRGARLYASEYSKIFKVRRSN